MDFFSILPSEIIVDILSRLNVGDILRCKRVCKSWLHLVGTDHFVNSHLSRSVSGLLVINNSAYCRILEFAEGNGIQHTMTDPNSGDDKYDIEMHEVHFNSVISFNIPLCQDTQVQIHTSVNGLLFLVKSLWMDYTYETNYICNPITREYINISRFFCYPHEFVRYGFGVSKLGQYKVLRVSQRNQVREKLIHVYTIGSGSWRSVAPPDPSLCGDIPLESDGPCLVGRFYWLNHQSSPRYILCFDLETELFSICDVPLQFDIGRSRNPALSALGNSLCLCDSMTSNEIHIWLAEERGGVLKSWIKQFVIPNTPCMWCSSISGASVPFISPLRAVKVFKNGDILMKYMNSLFLYHSSQNKRCPYVGRNLELDCWERNIIYTPNFISLTSFNMEKVISF